MLNISLFKWKRISKVISHPYHIFAILKISLGNSLTVQWLGLHASTAGGTSSIPGWGNKILQATYHGQKEKKKKKERKKKEKKTKTKKEKIKISLLFEQIKKIFNSWMVALLI